MAVTLNGEEKLLCALLRAALTGGSLSEEEERRLAKTDRERLLSLAERHKVLPLLYDVLQDKPFMEKRLQKRIQAVTDQTVNQSYRLLFLTRRLVRALEAEGIPVIVLKGCGAAGWYPVPEYRKSGDIDLGLADQESAERAAAVLQREGFTLLEQQQTNHHIICENPEGICAELHSMPAEPFDSRELNEKTERFQRVCVENRIYRDTMGVDFPVPSDERQAMLLLLHMLQHFLRAGFGLKLLCDWVAFWNGVEEKETAERFAALSEDFKIDGFSRSVTLVCEKYLGLRKNRVYPEEPRFRAGYAEKFLAEIMEAEEFGRSGAQRMVVVRSRSMGAYLREFHHQMCLNYPAESERVWKWPLLWTKTFFAFARNNRRLERGGMRDILRKAGERAELMEEMKLYR